MQSRRAERTPRDDNREGGKDDYDPYLYRDPSKKVSDFETLANLIKSVLGTGLFAMPNAFAYVGLVVGLIGTVLMGLLITVSIQILLDVHHKMCIRMKKPTLTYDEVVVASLTSSTEVPWIPANLATFTVDVIFLTCYIGIGAIYVVFISGVVQECLDFHKTIEQGHYALILFPLFLLMNMTKNLQHMAYVSVVGNLFLLLSCAIGIYYMFKDGLGDSWVAFASDFNLYPKFIGTVFFSMCSPGIVLVLEHNMAKPWNYRRFCGVFNWGMVFIVAVHAFVGAIGYLKYGSFSLANFIRNHQDLDVPTIIALVLQALSIYFTYGLQCYMPITILQNEYILPALEDKICKGSPILWDVLVRVILTFITCILAAAIPKLDLFIGLVGSFGISALATTIPFTLYILINTKNFGKLKQRFIFGTSMLVIGTVAGLCSMIVNVFLIIQFFQHGY